MKRKLSISIFAFVLLLTPLHIENVLAAEEVVKPSNELNGKVTEAIKDVTAEGKEGKVEINGMTVHIDQDYIQVDRDKKSVTLHEEKPITNQRIRLEGATIAHGIVFIPPERQNNSYPGQGHVQTFLMLTDTDGPIGPLSIEGDIDVNTSNNKTGSFAEDFANVEADWNYLEMFDEYEYEFAFTPVEKTKFYEIETNLNVEFLTDQDSVTETVGPILANKKAFEYPCRYFDPREVNVPGQCHGGDFTTQLLYADPYSDKVMFTPDTTTMSQVPPEDRVPWNNELRGEYIAEYIDRYGDPTKKDPDFAWKDYDIHHIIPREYGGSNYFNNLIPLKREFHSQNVTPWWTNY
ncbi:HNH endonuclease signature motif containing protein [Virgibacillus salexigens]|uniref:HNH endonuclease signature motif containing protein n=1 Tax=Virgibacillus salexigens TaxID=61016 RepID=UPI003081EECB